MRLSTCAVIARDTRHKLLQSPYCTLEESLREQKRPLEMNLGSLCSKLLAVRRETLEMVLFCCLLANKSLIMEIEFWFFLVLLRRQPLHTLPLYTCYAHTTNYRQSPPTLSFCWMLTLQSEIELQKWYFLNWPWVNQTTQRDNWKPTVTTALTTLCLLVLLTSLSKVLLLLMTTRDD